ncbi:RNA-directed DNA polymerase, eukaryota [Tanacetum coccineum]
MDSISDMEIKFLWGNSLFEASISEAIGNSGGILCVWDPNVFSKSNHVVSDNFVAVYGNWIPNNMDLLIISVYAPLYYCENANFWNFISVPYNLVGMVNIYLVDVQLEGYAFTWAHPSAAKMSKLDRFLVSEGLIYIFPHMSAICLDRHLSDHRPILLRDVIADFGAIPLRLYNSWLGMICSLVSNIWNSTILIDRNGMVRFIKKLQILKKEIRLWNMSMRKKQSAHINDIKTEFEGKIKWAIGGRTRKLFFSCFWSLEKRVSYDEIRDAGYGLRYNKVDGGLMGIKVDSSITPSHLFYADDAIFVGEWSNDNLRNIMYMLKCFAMASGLGINLNKSHLLGVGVPNDTVSLAAGFLGCGVLKTPFKYLGITVGGSMSKVNAWADCISKIKARLSKWKVRTLSIGGRLTLLKSVLGSTPIYSMSMYKAPKSVLNKMEALRRDFFNGVQGHDRKIAWIKWAKVLASKKYGGLGVSSYYALNRALLFKWLWRFISCDGSLWFRFIKAIHGNSMQVPSSCHSSPWSVILKEVSALKSHGVDLLSHCKIRVGSGRNTRFWSDVWLGESRLSLAFPRLFQDTEGWTK